MPGVLLVKRAALGMFLGATVLVLGLFTLFLCSGNRARGADLDGLCREIENLVLRNARSRATVFGHAPGEPDVLERQSASELGKVSQ